jgi:predicted Rossmann-fold nucleotide-binding protein
MSARFAAGVLLLVASMPGCSRGTPSCPPQDPPLPIRAEYADGDEIGTTEALLAQKPNLAHRVIRGVDLSTFALPELARWNVKDSVFLGARLSSEQRAVLARHGAVTVEALHETRFDPYRGQLYSQKDLDTSDAKGAPTLDQAIFEEYESAGRFPADPLIAQARMLHDAAMEDALREFLATTCSSKECKGFVGIVGGASEPRGTPDYVETVRIARALTLAGYFVVTGGGPGMMEAANLGAFMAGASDEELNVAIASLRARPKYAPGPDDLYTTADYKAVARQLREQFATSGRPSLGLPTWFYGHEPTNAFATTIAKYFSNGIREERLLEVASRGLVVVRGSAGTRQEIFMEAAQEHYATFGYCAPIIFVGDAFKAEYEAVHKAAESASTVSDPSKRTFYVDGIRLTSSAEDVASLLDGSPRMVAQGTVCPRP